MACITWELPSGEQYLIPEGKAHNPPAGAFNTGIVDWTCEGGTQRSEVEAMLAKAEIPWGSAIAWVTKQIGMKQCSACKASEVILDHVRANGGWGPTLKLIKEARKLPDG